MPQTFFQQYRLISGCCMLCMAALLLVNAFRQPVKDSDQYAAPDSVRDRLFAAREYLPMSVCAVPRACTCKQKRQVGLIFDRFLPCVWTATLNVLQKIGRLEGVTMLKENSIIKFFFLTCMMASLACMSKIGNRPSAPACSGGNWTRIDR